MKSWPSPNFAYLGQREYRRIAKFHYYILWILYPPPNSSHLLGYFTVAMLLSKCRWCAGWRWWGRDFLICWRLLVFLQCKCVAESLDCKLEFAETIEKVWVLWTDPCQAVGLSGEFGGFVRSEICGGEQLDCAKGITSIDLYEFVWYDVAWCDFGLILVSLRVPMQKWTVQG